MCLFGCNCVVVDVVEIMIVVIFGCVFVVDVIVYKGVEYVVVWYVGVVVGGVEFGY